MMGRLELCVSYWEYVKLIVAAILMALAIDAVGFAIWWWIMK